MNKKELLEKRTNALVEAEKVLASASDKPAEKREKFDRIMADVESIDGDLRSYEKLEAAKELRKQSTAGFIPNVKESNDPEERAEVRKKKDGEALRKWMATGAADTSRMAIPNAAEMRDITVVGTSSITLPVSFQSEIYEGLKSYGELYNLVNVLRLPHSEPRKLVLANDTANGWANVSVGTDVSDVDPTLTGITLSTDIISTSLIKVGIDLLNDSGFDVSGWVQDELGVRYARGAAKSITVGGGPTGQVAGIVAAIVAAGGNINTTNTSNVVYADLVKAFTTLDPAYQADAVFAMNNTTLWNLALLTDSQNRPLWLPNYGSLQGTVGEYSDGSGTQFTGSILGKPVKLVTDMSNAGSGNICIMFGDFKKGYTYREPSQGLMVARMNERYLPSYEVGFVGFAKVGGTLTDPGTHPIIALGH